MSNLKNKAGRHAGAGIGGAGDTSEIGNSAQGTPQLAILGQIGKAARIVLEVGQKATGQRFPGPKLCPKLGIEDYSQEILAMICQHLGIQLEKLPGRFIPCRYLPETVKTVRWKCGILHQ